MKESDSLDRLEREQMADLIEAGEETVLNDAQIEGLRRKVEADPNLAELVAVTGHSINAVPRSAYVIGPIFVSRLNNEKAFMAVQEVFSAIQAKARQERTAKREDKRKAFIDSLTQ